MAIVRRGELLPYKGDFYLWKYVPSMAAAVIFLIIYLIASFMHAWKMWKTRMWFCTPLVIGGFCLLSSFKLAVMFVTLIFSSGSHRLWRSYRCEQCNRFFDALHHPIRLPPGTAVPFRRFYLHDPWARDARPGPCC